MRKAVLVVAGLVGCLLAVQTVKAQPRKRPAKKVEVAVVAPVLDPELAREIQVVAEKGTRSADMATRGISVESLWRVDPVKATEYVVDAAQDPQWVVRYLAISTLIRMKNAAYRGPLVNAVANPALYEDAQRSPLNLVQMLGAPEAVELLKEAIERFEAVRELIFKEIFRESSPLARDFYESLRGVPEVYAWVMAHLEIFRDKALYPLLLRTIPSLSKENLLKVLTFVETLGSEYDVSFLDGYFKGTDPELQEAAAFIMTSRGDRRGLDLMMGLCDENEIRRQLRCLRAIKGMAQDPEVKERAKMFLFGDPDSEVLYAVYDLFTAAGDVSIYERMVARLQSTTNVGHREAAVYFIPKLQGTRALPDLHKLLRDGAPSIRLRAAQAVGELRQAESVPFLDDALRNDTNVDVRRELVRALARIADRSIIPVVSFLIFDPDVKTEAVKALCRVNHRDAIATLRNVLQAQFPSELRTLALKTIIRISPAEGLPVFQTCLGWIPEGLLMEMAEELGRDFLAYLRVAMASYNARVQREAILAFRFMGEEVEMELLTSQLFLSRDTTLRVEILRRIAQVKKQGALSILDAFLKDANRDLRLTAIAEIATLTEKGSEVEGKLRLMLMDPDDVYRVAAAKALLDIHLGPVN